MRIYTAGLSCDLCGAKKDIISFYLRRRAEELGNIRGMQGYYPQCSIYLCLRCVEILRKEFKVCNKTRGVKARKRRGL